MGTVTNLIRRSSKSILIIIVLFYSTYSFAQIAHNEISVEDNFINLSFDRINKGEIVYKTKVFYDGKEYLILATQDKSLSTPDILIQEGLKRNERDTVVLIDSPYQSILRDNRTPWFNHFDYFSKEINRGVDSETRSFLNDFIIDADIIAEYSPNDRKINGMAIFIQNRVKKLSTTPEVKQYFNGILNDSRAKDRDSLIIMAINLYENIKKSSLVRELDIQHPLYNSSLDTKGITYRFPYQIIQRNDLTKFQFKDLPILFHFKTLPIHITKNIDEGILN